MKINITICFFGMYNKHYARTSTLREGLHRLGAHIIEIHEEIPNERMELPEDFTLWKTVHRLQRKTFSLFRLLLQSWKISKSHAVIVLHPGHVELPFACLLTKIFGKQLLFDSSLSLYDTMFIGRGIADKSSFKARFVKNVESLLLKLPNKVFVDTDGMREFLIKELRVSPKKLFTVPLGANDAIYFPFNGKRCSSEKIDVLFFGLYNPMHGALVILEAAKMLRNQRDIVFTMLGDGYLKDDLIAFAKKEKLQNIRFVGFLPEVELVKRIQKADVLLGVFSKSPLFERVIPNKVFAALACRKPLITADRPIIRSLFRHNTDLLLCPTEDPTSLAKAILRLARSPKTRERLAHAGYKRYKEIGTPEAIATLFLEKGLGISL